MALVLVAAGLMSSTLHLANPKNVWRAVTRVRTSWLSREGVLALIFFPVAFAWLAAGYFGVSAGLQTTAGIAALLLAWATLFSTGMIYACLKTIPRWNNRLVPAAYMANGHLSGALILLALAAADRKPTGLYVVLVLVFLVLAAAVKGAYFRKFRPAATGAHSLSAAVGMTAASAKLLDAGHTHGTFLTEEFVFRLGRERANQLRLMFVALSLCLPALVVGFGMRMPAVLAVAAVACLAGLVIERWLFFAEAQHVVRLFHGQRTV
jgi:DMSO reductase anchor subunit